MDILESEINTHSEDFAANKEHFLKILNQWQSRSDEVKKGGGEKSIERHRSRGKMTARERIENLTDPDTAFLEFSALAAWEMFSSSISSLY